MAGMEENMEQLPGQIRNMQECQTDAVSTHRFPVHGFELRH